TLRELFRTLREREIDTATLAIWRGGSRMSGAALSVFAEYERLLEVHRLYDDRIGLDAATERTRELTGDGFREIGPVLVYLPPRPSPAAARLVRALGERGPVEIALALIGDALGDEEARATAQTLEVDPPQPAGPAPAQHH